MNGKKTLTMGIILPKIVVVTGAESTGKSTLVKELAHHLEAKYYPEFARDYITNLKHSYTFEDVEFIAREQARQYEEALNSNHSFIIFDTWLIVTCVWMEVVYNKKPTWLVEYIRQAKIDLFLLCDTNIPWVDDPVRENGGKMREILHEKYKEELLSYPFKFEIISGIGKPRIESGLSFLKKF